MDVGSWTYWVRKLPALGRRFSVHALDLPGCGDSDEAAEAVNRAMIDFFTRDKRGEHA